MMISSRIGKSAAVNRVSPDAGELTNEYRVEDDWVNKYYNQEKA